MSAERLIPIADAAYVSGMYARFHPDPLDSKGHGYHVSEVRDRGDGSKKLIMDWEGEPNTVREFVVPPGGENPLHITHVELQGEPFDKKV